MVSRTIVIGNGVGRAINNDFFSLDAALRCAWDEDGLLSDHQKRLIRSCLPDDVVEREGAPTSEDELEDLQRIVSACDEIAKMERRAVAVEGWLSQNGQEFPKAIRTYLHRAARYFLDREGLPRDARNLPEDFSKALRGHIMKVGANIVTLNYDDLLYECFIGTEVFQRHRLRDGFLRGVFNIAEQDEWIARASATEGWFLHLHGSPLFLTSGGAANKLTRHELKGYGEIDSTHLVLTNVKYKASIIDASEILSEYWKRFASCCRVAEDLLILGYGGGDLHLNKMIANIPEDAKIRVVQRQVPGREREELIEEWKERLSGRSVEIILMDNILDFRDF